MKKIVLSLLSVTVIATAANAQLAIAPELGLNLSNITGKSGGVSSDTKMKAGLSVGAVIDLNLTDNISFQPGVFYRMTGYKSDFAGTDITANVNTIEIPLNFQYKFGEAGHNYFFAGVGPYVGYNFSGKVKGGGTTTDLEIGTDKVKDNIKPLDFGAGINAGYAMTNGFYARAHYQMGFANLDPISDADNTMHTSAIGVTVGYYLNAHKAHKAHKPAADKK
jgi:hypothetical protein